MVRQESGGSVLEFVQVDRSPLIEAERRGEGEGWGLRLLPSLEAGMATLWEAWEKCRGARECGRRGRECEAHIWLRLIGSPPKRGQSFVALDELLLNWERWRATNYGRRFPGGGCLIRSTLQNSADPFSGIRGREMVWRFPLDPAQCPRDGPPSP